jgi:hypothetical protein
MDTPYFLGRLLPAQNAQLRMQASARPPTAFRVDCAYFDVGRSSTLRPTR